MVFPVKIQSFGKVELQQSLFGKVEPDSKTIGRNFELTINVDHLESVEVSGQRQSFIFSISEKSWTTLVFRPNNKMASEKSRQKQLDVCSCSCTFHSIRVFW